MSMMSHGTLGGEKKVIVLFGPSWGFFIQVDSNLTVTFSDGLKPTSLVFVVPSTGANNM